MPRSIVWTGLYSCLLHRNYTFTCVYYAYRCLLIYSRHNTLLKDVATYRQLNR